MLVKRSLLKSIGEARKHVSISEDNNTRDLQRHVEEADIVRYLVELVHVLLGDAEVEDVEVLAYLESVTRLSLQYDDSNKSQAKVGVSAQ